MIFLRRSPVCFAAACSSKMEGMEERILKAMAASAASTGARIDAFDASVGLLREEVARLAEQVTHLTTEAARSTFVAEQLGSQRQRADAYVEFRLSQSNKLLSSDVKEKRDAFAALVQRVWTGGKITLHRMCIKDEVDAQAYLNDVPTDALGETMVVRRLWRSLVCGSGSPPPPDTGGRGSASRKGSSPTKAASAGRLSAPPAPVAVVAVAPFAAGASAVADETMPVAASAGAAAGGAGFSAAAVSSPAFLRGGSGEAAGGAGLAATASPAATAIGAPAEIVTDTSPTGEGIAGERCLDGVSVWAVLDEIAQDGPALAGAHMIVGHRRWPRKKQPASPSAPAELCLPSRKDAASPSAAEVTLRCLSGEFDSESPNGLMLFFDKVWETSKPDTGAVKFVLHGTLGVAEAFMEAAVYDTTLRELLCCPCCAGMKMKAAAEPQEDDEGPPEDEPFKIADASIDLEALDEDEQPLWTLMKPQPSCNSPDPKNTGSGSSSADGRAHGSSGSDASVSGTKPAATASKHALVLGSAFVSRKL